MRYVLFFVAVALYGQTANVVQLNLSETADLKAAVSALSAAKQAAFNARSAEEQARQRVCDAERKVLKSRRLGGVTLCETTSTSTCWADNDRVKGAIVPDRLWEADKDGHFLVGR